MEIIKILWIIIFFFFTLMLIFIWSKITLISNKIKKVSAVIDKAQEVSFYTAVEEEEGDEEEKNENNVEK
jgi:hypothetical protein